MSDATYSAYIGPVKPVPADHGFTHVDHGSNLRRRLETLGSPRLSEMLLRAARRHPDIADLIREALADARSVEPSPPALSARSAKGTQPSSSTGDEPHMVGSSPQMAQVFDRIRRFGQTDFPVLITGESGTGKEMAALAIHERSANASGPFVAVNCGALPPSLIGSELFGHERGAFTGAVERRIGKIEQARNGTLFLDEIGDLPLEIQAHLLRFLQEQTIERVGGQTTLHIQTRIIAATNVNLEKAVAEKRFRKDLYFRLDVLGLHLPPLRERQDDIAVMVRYFVEKFSREFDREPPGIEQAALDALKAHPWPGNVRELISKIRRAIVMCDGAQLSLEDFNLEVVDTAPDTPAAPAATAGGEPNLNQVRSRAEAESVLTALNDANFNVSKAARQLGVSRITMYNLMKKHSITRQSSAT